MSGVTKPAQPWEVQYWDPLAEEWLADWFTGRAARFDTEERAAGYAARRMRDGKLRYRVVNLEAAP